MNSLKTKLIAAGVLAVLSVPLAGSAAHAAGPANDNFINSEVLAASGSIVRSNTGATTQASEPASSIADPFATIWFKWTAPTTGRVTFDTLGTDIDTSIVAWTGNTLVNLNEVASNNDVSCGNTPSASAIQFDAVLGTAYRIQIGAINQGDFSDNIDLTWNWARGPQAANDDLAHAVSLTSSQTVNGTTTNSTNEPNLPIFEGTQDASVWYQIAAPSPTAADINLTSSNVLNNFGLNALVSAEIWGGTSPASASLLATLLTDATNPTTVHLATPGTIWIRVFSSDMCDWGNFSLKVSSRSGTAITTTYSPAEFQLLTDAATRLGWTPEQFQHDAVLLWQFIYALAGITTPTPVSPPSPGTSPIASVWAPSEMAQLNSLNNQWVLSSTDTQHIASMVLVFVLSLG